MNAPLQHPDEAASNQARAATARVEPRSLRTYTPTQAVLARSSGVFHWTPEGRRLYDFTSGVLVSNLGHNPTRWMERFVRYMGWPALAGANTPLAYFSALTMTAYNAVTPVEVEAAQRLVAVLQARPGGGRLQQVIWAASGSEAIQKALWAALAHDRSRDMIVATRYGFHGKKGLAGAVTGCETDHDRDPRPLHQLSAGRVRRREQTRRRLRSRTVSPRTGRTVAPVRPAARRPHHGAVPRRRRLVSSAARYLQMLERFCRENDIVFILDEVQSNFGRTGALFAFETYGIEPDMVVLGKGLGNGVPVSAAVGRADLFATLEYGEASDTWSGNTLGCAAVLATLEEFAAPEVLTQSRRASAIVEAGLVRLQRLPFMEHVRGERGGMVWGVETCDHADKSATDWANALVLACYRGDPTTGDGIHLLGPLAKKVIRIAPPLVLTEAEAEASLRLMNAAAAGLAEQNVHSERMAEVAGT